MVFVFIPRLQLTVARSIIFLFQILVPTARKTSHWPISDVQNIQLLLQHFCVILEIFLLLASTVLLRYYPKDVMSPFFFPQMLCMYMFLFWM